MDPQRVDDNIVIMGATCENETLKTTFVIKDSNDMIFSKFTKDQIEEIKKRSFAAGIIAW